MLYKLQLLLYTEMNHFISIRHTKKKRFVCTYPCREKKQEELAQLYTTIKFTILNENVKAIHTQIFGTLNSVFLNSIQPSSSSSSVPTEFTFFFCIYENDKIDNRAYTMSRKFAFQFVQFQFFCFFSFFNLRGEIFYIKKSSLHDFHRTWFLSSVSY